MFFLAYGPQPGGPIDKLCPSEEPKEAMADRGPNGRMVPTRRWRTHTPNESQCDGLAFKPNIRQTEQLVTRSVAARTEPTSSTSRLETVQPEREQTPGSKNLRRWAKYVLRSDPMEGKRNCVFGNVR